MEYKVVKENGFFQKGDILKWEDEAQGYVLEVKNGNTYRAAIVDATTADKMYEQGYLSAAVKPVIDKSAKVIEYIHDLLNKYEEAQKETIEKYNNKEIPECVKVEATTVHYNLTKVLNKIKELLNEQAD